MFKPAVTIGWHSVFHAIGALWDWALASCHKKSLQIVVTIFNTFLGVEIHVPSRLAFQKTLWLMTVYPYKRGINKSNTSLLLQFCQQRACIARYSVS